MAWILAEWTLRSTLLIVFAGATLWGLRVKDAPLRLTAWTAVLAGVLLMPLFQMAVPTVAIAVPRPWTRSAATKSGRAPSPLPFHLMEPAAGESAGRWSMDWPNAAAFVGLTGAVAMMSRLLAGLYFTRRLIRASRKIREGVRESESITVPATAGLLRPVVLLPPVWREWEPAKLRAVMAHEGAHARGYDPLRRFLASVYRASCWYNPLAWWLSAHLAALAEAKSDDAALAEVRDEALYAEILVSFWERAPRRVIWEGVGMSRSGKLTRRMERILDSERRLSASVAQRRVGGGGYRSLSDLRERVGKAHVGRAAATSRDIGGACCSFDARA